MKKQERSNTEDSMNALCKDLLDALKELMNSKDFMDQYKEWKRKNEKT